MEPPEGSAHAAHCARFYPIARDELLERRAWSFAVRRVSLGDPLVYTASGYSYAYAAPADMIRPLAVYDPELGESFADPVEFDTESRDDGTTIIITDQPDAELRYIFRQEVPARFSPLFTTALSWLLASYIAGAVVKGEAGVATARTCYQAYMATMAEAAASNANASQQTNERTAPWVAAR